MIYSTMLHICDVCRKLESVVEEADVFSDSVIEPLPGWELVFDDDKPSLLCPECFAKDGRERR